MTMHDTQGGHEKDTPAIEFSTVSCMASQSATPAEDRRWNTFALHGGPSAGLASILLAFISILVSLGILLGARGASISSWAVPPSTYLAICTAVANQAVRLAAFQGAIIAWWHQAIRGPTTVKRLDANYRAGMTIMGAFTAGRHMGVLGLACILSVFVAIDGPLLQKAVTVMSVPLAQTVPLNVSMAKELPRGFTGQWATGSTAGIHRTSPQFNDTKPTASGGEIPNDMQTRLTPLFQQLVAAPFTRGTPMTGFVAGCPEGYTCTAKIQAPVFAVTSCASHAVPVNYSAPTPELTATSYYANAAPFNRDLFFVDVDLVADDTEWVNLVTGYSETEDCAGVFTYSACTLQSAIGEWDISVRDSLVNLATSDGPSVVALANNTARIPFNTAAQDHPSTLAGIAALISDIWDDLLIAYHYHGKIHTTYSGYRQVGYAKFQPGRENDPCPSYSDPQNDVVRDLNLLMFYSGYLSAQYFDKSWFADRVDHSTSDVNTIVTGHIQGNHDVYSTDLHWFVAAAVVESICCCFILWTYVGFWRIGRPISMSPLEVAKAFEAPLLSASHSNSSGRDVAKTVGDMRAQYGATTSSFQGTIRLAFANPDQVTRPTRHQLFDL